MRVVQVSAIADSIIKPSRRLNAWIIFCGFAALLLGYSFATAPFRAPDEFNHFFRAYQIASGHLIAKRMLTGLLGDQLPSSLMRSARSVANYPGLPSNSLDPGALSAARKIPLVPSDQTFTHFPNTALYSPVSYSPAALGILLGRIFNAGPISLLYLARWGNALVGAALLAYAISRAAPVAVLFAMVALLPMSLFQMGVISIDAVTTGLTFVWCSEWIRVRQSGTLLGPTQCGRFLVLALLLSQLKPPYPAIVLLALVFPRPAFLSHRTAFLFPLSLVLAALIPCIIWASLVWPLQVTLRPGVTTNSLEQLLFVFHHPLQFLRVAINELWSNGHLYIQQLIGTFGWANLPLPDWIVFGYAGVLLATVSTIDTSELRLGAPLRSFLLCLAVAGVFAIQLLIYMNWNVVGAGKIEGVQGRYLIPFALIAALAFANDSLSRANLRWLRHVTVPAAVSLNLGALVFLARQSFFAQ